MCSTAARPDSKGAVESRHEYAPLKVQQTKANSAAGVANIEPRAGRAGRVVVRPEQPGLLGEIGNNRLLVPDMIARSEQIDFGIQDFFGNLRGHAETGGGIFHVGDAQIDVLLLNDGVDLFFENFPAGFAKDIADK